MPVWLHTGMAVYRVRLPSAGSDARSMSEEGESIGKRGVSLVPKGHTYPMTSRPGAGAARSTPGTEFDGLLDAARSGTGWACTHIYESLAPGVAGYLRARGADEPDDLVSEVFLRVFSGCRSFSGDEAQFRTWVFTIAHSRLVDAWRVKDRGPEVGVLDEERCDRQGLAVPGADEQAMDRLAVEEVDHLLDVLTSDQRDVLSLRIVTQMSVEEVATVLAKPPGAIKASSIGRLPPSGVGSSVEHCSHEPLGTERPQHGRGRGH